MKIDETKICGKAAVCPAPALPVNTPQGNTTLYERYKAVKAGLAEKIQPCPVKRTNVPLLLLFLGVLGAYTSLIYWKSYDNDIWFILATGREIVENGIPYTNPFTIHSDMSIVVQQWIPDVIAYGIYSLGGFVGLGLWLVFCIAVLIFSLLMLGKVKRGNSYGLEIVALFIIPLLPALAAYLSIRPHVYTMIAFCWVMWVCEKYRATNNRKYLIWLPVIVAIHINFHMAMAPFDLFIILCYMIPDFLEPFHKRGKLLKVSLGNDYNRIPMYVAFVVSAFALLLNPYGIDGALYLVNSLGAAEYESYIKEMGTLTVWCDFGIMMIINLILGCIAIGKNGFKNIQLPLIILFFLTMILGFQRVRNVWLVSLFAFPLIMEATKTWSFDISNSKSAFLRDTKPLSIIAGAGAAIITIGCLYICTPGVDYQVEDNTSTPVVAMDYIEEHSPDKENTKIFNFFNVGGYVSWRGYKCFMDPRPELWEPGISKQEEHYYRDFVDMCKGTKAMAAETIRKYDFDYLIVNTDTKMKTWLDEDQSDYKIVAEGNQYQLWAKTTASTNNGATE